MRDTIGPLLPGFASKGVLRDTNRIILPVRIDTPLAAREKLAAFRFGQEPERLGGKLPARLRHRTNVDFYPKHKEETGQ